MKQLSRLSQIRRFVRGVYAPHKLALRQEVPRTLRDLGVRAPSIVPSSAAIQPARVTPPRPVTPQPPASPARPASVPVERAVNRSVPRLETRLEATQPEASQAEPMQPEPAPLESQAEALPLEAVEMMERLAALNELASEQGLSQAETEGDLESPSDAVITEALALPERPAQAEAQPLAETPRDAGAALEPRTSPSAEPSVSELPPQIEPRIEPSRQARARTAVESDENPSRSEARAEPASPETAPAQPESAPSQPDHTAERSLEPSPPAVMLEPDLTTPDSALETAPSDLGLESEVSPEAIPLALEPERTPDAAPEVEATPQPAEASTEPATVIPAFVQAWLRQEQGEPSLEAALEPAGAETRATAAQPEPSATDLEMVPEDRTSRVPPTVVPANAVSGESSQPLESVRGSEPLSLEGSTSDPGAEPSGLEPVKAEPSAAPVPPAHPESVTRTVAAPEISNLSPETAATETGVAPQVPTQEAAPPVSESPRVSGHRVIEEYRARPPRNLPPRPAKLEAPEPEPEAAPGPSRPPEAWMKALRETYTEESDLPAETETVPSSDATFTSEELTSEQLVSDRVGSERAVAALGQNAPEIEAVQPPVADSDPVGAASSLEPSLTPMAAEAPIPEDFSKRNLSDWQRALSRLFAPQPERGDPDAAAPSDPAPAARVPPSSDGVRGESSRADPARTVQVNPPRSAVAARETLEAPRPARRFIEPRQAASSPVNPPRSALAPANPGAPVASSVNRAASQVVIPDDSRPASNPLPGPVSARAANTEPSGTNESSPNPSSPNPSSPVQFNSARAPLERIELSGAARRFLEPLVGFDPGGVSVYGGETATRIARDLGADAAAVDGSVVMGDSANLESPEQLGLLAHELTHVPGQRRFVAPSANQEDLNQSRLDQRPPPVVRDAAQTASEEDRARLTEARVTRAARAAPLSADPLSQDRFQGLPAPWEPMPELEFGEARQGAEGRGRRAESNVISLVGAGLSPSSWGDAVFSAPPAQFNAPAVSAPAASSGNAQLAETGREEAAEGDAGAQGGQGQDLEKLARQVYDVLKRKLAHERSRGGF